MNYYTISEKRLKELMLAELNLSALEQGGVDNWEWYGASVSDFLNHLSEEYKQNFEDFEDMAEFFMKNEFGKAKLYLWFF